MAVLLEKLDVVRAMFHGHDYSAGLSGEPAARLAALAAIDLVLSRQHEASAQIEGEEGKRKALRRFQDAVLELGKAFALAAASDQARSIRDEVGFFQAVRAAIVKSFATGKLSTRSRQFAIEQLMNDAIASAEIVDILHAAGIQAPDISILSDEFLLEVQNLERKNLALEALRKLLNGEIKSRSTRNVVESKAFSRRLEDAVARYHANAISTAEMIQALIVLAKDMKASVERGTAEGLSPQELAFYDALAQNDSAVEVLGNEKLRRLLSAEPWAAFDLEDLPGLFHALNVAMLSCYAYAPHEDRINPPRPGRVHLRFTGTGGALLVERARSAAGVISVAIHGEDGAAILQIADAELHALIDAISAAIARAGWR